MKERLALLSLCFVLVTCVTEKPNKYSISGKSEGYPDSTMIVLEDREHAIYVDTSYIIDNEFHFEGRVERPTYHTFLIGIDNSIEFEFKNFWLENKELLVSIKKGEMRFGDFTGSELQKQADLLEIRKREIVESQNGLIDQIRNTDIKNQAIRDSLFKELDRLNKLFLQEDTLFIREFPNSLHSSYQLMAYKNSLPKSATNSLYKNLNKDIQGSRYGKVVEKYLRLGKDLRTGDSAVNFSLPDLNNNLIELGEIKNKYILLEFWGSSCAPCRQENPNLLKNYLTYRDQGFEILGVTLDRQKNDWQTAVLKDSMIWKTVGDMHGLEGEVPITYGVNYMPKNFLINPEGKIIASDIRGEDLSLELKEIFGY